MEKDVQSEVISTWGQKGNLEKALLVGISGMPEFKRDEKMYYLGEFKERVLRLLSRKQVAEGVVYPEIMQALQDQRAAKMIIDGSLSGNFIGKYRRLAIKLKRPYTVRSDPEFKGSTGLIVVSEEAVDIPVITVENRNVRLKRLGMSPALIDSVGKKVCKRCFGKIVAVDPNEAVNYRQLTWIDRLGGEQCPAHHND